MVYAQPAAPNGAQVDQLELPARPSPTQPVVPEDPELSSKTAEPDPDWKPTTDPKPTVVAGQMRSDREEIPAPFTKADADKAETMEAALIQEQQSARGISLLVAPGCQVYWPSPYEVCGAIRDKYNALGGPASFLSFPSTGELTNPDGYGKRSQFLNGPIYWSPQGGAHPVVNSFLNRWGIHQYEAGWLKYPTTDEIVLPDGGRRQEFEFGAIYVAFQNAVGSAIRNGAVRDKYNLVGGLTPGGTLLGYPIQDQVGLPDGLGQMSRFQNGVIYWSPATGAYTVHGEILARWEDAGFESGDFGYPIAEQVTLPNDEYTQQFQNGTIGVYTVFTGGFEWQDTAGLIKWCVFEARSDYVHRSTWKFPDGTIAGNKASGHGWWKAISNCKPMTTADVTAQLQFKNASGEWVYRGDVGLKENLYPGGGGSNRTPANAPCNGSASTNWRVVVDVDVNGSPDAPDLYYGVPQPVPCG